MNLIVILIAMATYNRLFTSLLVGILLVIVYKNQSVAIGQVKKNFR